MILRIDKPFPSDLRETICLDDTERYSYGRFIDSKTVELSYHPPKDPRVTYLVTHLKIIFVAHGSVVKEDHGHRIKMKQYAASLRKYEFYITDFREIISDYAYLFSIYSGDRLYLSLEPFKFKCGCHRNYDDVEAVKILET
jgi:hypothetical protein